MNFNRRYYVLMVMSAILISQECITELYAQDYVKTDFMISDVTEYNYFGPQLSISGEGDMAVVWETSGSGDIWYKTITSTGDAISDQKAVATTYSTSVTRIAHADTGNFMIIYGGLNSAWKVFGQVFDRNGNEISDTLTLSRNTNDFINTAKASVFSNRNNEFVVYMPTQDSIIVETVSGSGEFAGNTVALKPDAVSYSFMIAALNYTGDHILIWLDNSDGELHGLKYSPDGTPIGESFQISHKASATYLDNFTLAFEASDNFIVVWTGSHDDRLDLYSQLMNSNGEMIGLNKQVTDNQSVFYQSGALAVGMDRDGNSVIAWPDNRNGDTTKIYIQQMDNQGEPVGGNFLATSVNNNIESVSSKPSQVNPCIKLLNDTIYLTWINHNANIHHRTSVYSNIQKWLVPEISGIANQNSVNSDIRIYPNPSEGIFTLMSDQVPAGLKVVKVYNSAGVFISSRVITWLDEKASIDLSDIPEGTYFIQISGEPFVATQYLTILR